jgi:tRNA-dihydrouridine synthase B
MRIGPYQLPSRVLLAPMAGITDRAFRTQCRRFGAGLAAAEMLTSDVRLWNTPKSRRRKNFDGESGLRVVQIAGWDPAMMAQAARQSVDEGAQIIDINMGCPAKKVCNRLAGSALLQDEPLVARILEAVVHAVNVPVTLKTRTGWDRSNRNGVRIARLAQDCGVAAIAIHGRTRSDMYKGNAEYDTVRDIKSELRIPVIANGDIATPQQAAQILRHTGCDALMIGRAAFGKPWIFDEVNFFLATGELRAALAPEIVRDIMRAHLEDLYSLYGDETGVRVARKHLSWYCQHSNRDQVRTLFLHAATPQEQLAVLRQHFG